MDNQPTDDRPLTDEEVRERLKRFARSLRSAGLVGDTAANVGESREANINQDPNDGLPPMMNSVPQVDR
jgi:hypothetical protein